MTIVLDFADPEQAGRFPSHGWAYNSQGVKVLWLPILRLVHKAPEIRKSRGITEELSRGQWSEIRAFEATTMHFALALRELHKCIRIVADPAFDGDDPERFNASHEASALLPLFVDLAFVYVRRLADHFARASRYVLFGHSVSAPREYKKLRSLVDDLARIQRLSPLCNASRLRCALARTLSLDG